MSHRPGHSGGGGGGGGGKPDKGDGGGDSTAFVIDGLDETSDTGYSSSDGLTNLSEAFILTGTIDPSITSFTIRINGTEYIITDIDPDTGVWSFTYGVNTASDDAAPLLGDGTVLVEAYYTTTPTKGKKAPITTYADSYSFEVDTTPPVAQVTAVRMADGTIALGGVTDDDTPVIQGIADAGATVEVFVKGVSIGTATADQNGNWLINYQAELADAVYTVTAVATGPDLAGNDPVMSGGFEMVVVSPPSPPPPGDYYHPDDPLYFDDKQWHLAMLGDIERIWAEFDGSGVFVGIYDNGVEWSHPDLFDNYEFGLRVTVGGEVLDPDPSESETVSGVHGTAVAGVIAAVDNSVGGVGVAFGASITGVNIFGGPADINGFDISGYAEAIGEAKTFDIINNSWGTAPDFNNEFFASTLASLSGFETAVLEGRGGLGTIIVKAAGNDYDNAQGDFLNTSRYTITVAAHDEDGDASWYTNRGANLLVSAPSSGSSADGDRGVVTTDLQGSGGYDSGAYTTGFGGTSSATPVVSGVVALMLDANPELGWRDVQSILAYSAHWLGGDPTASSPVPTSTGGTIDLPVEYFEWFYNAASDWNGGGLHFSEDYGFGGVDAYAAVRMAEVWTLFNPAQTSGNEWKVIGDTQEPNLVFTEDGAPSSVEAQFTYTDPMAPIELEYVEIYIEYSADSFSEISIDLISPNHTEVSLLQAVPTDVTGLEAWKTTNSFLPVEYPGTVTWTYGINAFRGEDPTGEWTVRITEVDPDNSVEYLETVFLDLDGGALDLFQMTFYGAMDQDDVYHYTAEMLSRGLYLHPDRVVLEDTGGTDWFDFSATAGDIVSDLSAGDLSAADLLAGFDPTGGITTLNGITIVQTAAGTLIENAVGGDGADTLLGNYAGNELYGMRGDDTLKGGDGADTLNGGAGNDFLWGDAGNDLFVFTLGDGVDWIGDFTAGGTEDAIALYGFGFDDLSSLDSLWFDSGGNAALDLSGFVDSNGDTLIFYGIDFANPDDLAFSESDFVFG